MMLSKGFNKAEKEAGRLKVFNEAEQKFKVSFWMVMKRKDRFKRLQKKNELK
ncbi:MAG: hypothetical protein HWD62_08650 [Cyclobacteriaceae bacterium]|nr:MAG: hypothetical protein HWD62_08650 [Cyclobacteriaceae bacterium]